MQIENIAIKTNVDTFGNDMEKYFDYIPSGYIFYSHDIDAPKNDYMNFYTKTKKERCEIRLDMMATKIISLMIDVSKYNKSVEDVLSIGDNVLKLIAMESTNDYLKYEIKKYDSDDMRLHKKFKKNGDISENENNKNILMKKFVKTAQKAIKAVMIDIVNAGEEYIESQCSRPFPIIALY